MKLVDADALIDALEGLRQVAGSNFVSIDNVQRVIHTDAPDASQPLRERVAELEAEVEMMRPWFEAAQKAIDSPGVPFQRQMEDEPNA